MPRDVPGDLAPGGLRHPRVRHGRDVVRNAGIDEEVDGHAGSVQPLGMADGFSKTTPPR